jgi:hypothetical protein
MGTLQLILTADNFVFLQRFLAAAFFLLQITFRGGLDEYVTSSRYSLY